VALHQSPDDVQPEARAFAYRLGRKERIEDAITYFDTNTTSIIDDPHHDELPLAPGDDFNLSAFRYSIQRVIDQVRPDLVEFACEPMYGR
jgi:hypothetical protein